MSIRSTLTIRNTAAAAAMALILATAAGCAVSRGQQTAGAYIDDTAITATVKTRMLDDERVAGTSITVETLNGTVMLSGFAKSQAEKAAAESIARKVDGVKAVKNEITVRAERPARMHGGSIHPTKEQHMNWDRIEGNWKQITGKAKVQWGKLTDDDLDVVAGRRDQLAGKIQERYGIAKDEAEKQLAAWESKADESWFA